MLGQPSIQRLIGLTVLLLLLGSSSSAEGEVKVERVVTSATSPATSNEMLTYGLVASLDFGGGLGTIETYASWAYVKTATSLDIWDISNAAEPARLSSLKLSSPYDTYQMGKGVGTVSLLPFVALYNYGGSEVLIVDVSDEQLPRIAGTYSGIGWVAGVTAKDNLLYVSDHLGESIVVLGVGVDGSLSVNNTIVGLGRVHDIDAEIDRVFVTTEAGRGGFRAYDISDPQSPFLGSEYLGAGGMYPDLINADGFTWVVTRGLTDSVVEFIQVHWNFVGPGQSELIYRNADFKVNNLSVGSGHIYCSVNESSVPVLPDGGIFTFSWDSLFFDNYDCDIWTCHPLSIYNPTENYGYLKSYGSFLYAMGGANCALEIIDVSDPKNPVGVSCYADNSSRSTGVTIGRTTGVASMFDNIYVADSRSGLKIFDISVVDDPTFVGHYSTNGNANRVTTDNTYAYVTVTDGPAVGVHQVDVTTDPTNPTARALFQTTEIPNDVEVFGDYCYVTQKDGVLGIWGKFEIFDVSFPGVISPIGFWEAMTPMLGLEISGNYAYVAELESGLVIYDVSDPSTPIPAAGYNTGGITGTNATDVALSGGYAYITDSSTGIHIVDVSVPTSPNYVSSYSLSGAVRIMVSGCRAFVATDSGDDLVILDVSDPENPAFLNVLETSPAIIEDIAPALPYVVLANGSGIEIWSTEAQPTDAIFVTSLSDSGPGSLRSALESATSRCEASRIGFLVSGTILLSTNLPDITHDGIFIDGSSAPGGAHSVIIDGSALPGALRVAIWVQSDLNEIAGLTIVNCGTSAIEVRGNYNSIHDNYIGVQSDGSSFGGNWMGIRIDSGSPLKGNLIGTEGANVISWNEYGIYMDNVVNGEIANNYIGVNFDGTTAAPNAGGTAAVRLVNTRGVVLKNNVISGNGSDGLRITECVDLLLENNFIGTNGAGTAAIPNQSNGLVMTNCDFSVVERNVISGNQLSGIEMSFCNADTLRGNYFGVDATGTLALPNATGSPDAAGVVISNEVYYCLVGGTETGSANVISGNSGYGIKINDNFDGTRIIGNYIGVGADLITTIPNDTGIHITGSPICNCVIGGTNPGEGNHISFNGCGIFIGVHMVTVSGNIIEGNFGDGVLLSQASDCIVTKNSIIENNRGIYVTCPTSNNCNQNVLLDNVVYGNILIDLDLDEGTNANDDILAPIVVVEPDIGDDYCIFGNGPNNGQIHLYLSREGANDGAHPNGFGGAIATSPTVVVNLDGSGFAIGECTVSLSDGDIVTALAVDMFQNTSQFSANWLIGEVQIINQSPTHIVVYAPNGDSIGVGFNTIAGAQYDSLTDSNNDGHLDDIVTLPVQIINQYTVKVLPDIGAQPTDSFTLIYISGNDTTILANSELVPQDSAIYTFDVVVPPPTCCDLPGDFDHNDAVDITDLTSVVDFMFRGGVGPSCTDEADVNADCALDITDLTYRVDFMFRGGPTLLCGCVGQ